MAGVSLQAVDGNALQFSVLSSAAGGQLPAPAAQGAGLIIRVYKLFLTSAGITSLKFQNGSTDLSGAMALVANSSIVLDMDGQPWFVCSPNTAFNVNSSAGVQISGTVYYTVSKF